MSPKLRKQRFVFNKLQFRILQGSVETLFRWSEKYLYHFVTNLFSITCAKFYKNWLRFVEDITKTILVCFYGTQCNIVVSFDIVDRSMELRTRNIFRKTRKTDIRYAFLVNSRKWPMCVWQSDVMVRTSDLRVANKNSQFQRKSLRNASVTKQCNLVSDKEQWCSSAGEITVRCRTGHESSTYGLKAFGKSWAPRWRLGVLVRHPMLCLYNTN